MTLLEIVQATPELSNLLTAIETLDASRTIPPDLADVLSGPEDLTVFAPINSAFEAVEAVAPGYLAMLLTPNFGLQLFGILAYHVTSGVVTTDQFPIANLEMLQSGFVNVTETDVVSFSPVPATVLEPFNIVASNGVAHLVNNVLIPRFVTQNLLTALLFFQATEGDNFSTLLRLVAAAGLEDTLAELEGVALLAPTNDAISPETEQYLLTPGNEEILVATLSYHVINEEMYNYAAQPIPSVDLRSTLQGERIVVGVIEEPEFRSSFNAATQLGYFPVQQNNGYVIDMILVPPSLSTVVPRTFAGLWRDPTITVEYSQAANRPPVMNELDAEEVSEEGAETPVEPADGVRVPPSPGIRRNDGWKASVVFHYPDNV